jgi:agmatinase
MPHKPLFRKPKKPFAGARTPRAVGQIEGGAAIFGAPHGTPYRGIDNRPHAASADALRKAVAADGDWRGHWDFDLAGSLLGHADFNLADLGDLPTKPGTGARNRELIEGAARAILSRNAVPIMIGGDDSTPIPFIRAFNSLEPLTVLQIDAHIDWRDERRGEKLGFSNTMRRVSEMEHVTRIMQVGARGIGSARKQEYDDALAWGAQIVPAAVIHASGIKAALDLIPRDANCLITIDCDALDGATMPAVMMPTPGGLTYRHIIDLIAGVAGKAKLVGMDMIEFVPARDKSGYSAYVAARIIWNVIGRLAQAADAAAGHSAAIEEGADRPAR